MSLDARPVRRAEVEAIFDKKMADFRHKATRLVLHHVDPGVYFDAASDDPDIRFALDTGFISDISSDLRDPVLVRLDDHQLVTCPALVLKVLADEPAGIHRAFTEGAFLRKLFRFFVPAAHEGGEGWEITEQVRDIMQRHFAFQLIACEAVLGQAA